MSVILHSFVLETSSRIVSVDVLFQIDISDGCLTVLPISPRPKWYL